MIQRSGPHIYKSDIPTFLNYIRAYRLWRIGYDGRDPWLLSLNDRFKWLYKEESHFRCSLFSLSHKTLDLSCTCGIYGWKKWRKEHLKEIDEGSVFGLINLWGKVIEHDLGYRAEYAYPSEFIIWCEICRSKKNLTGIFFRQRKYLKVICSKCWNPHGNSNVTQMLILYRDFGELPEMLDSTQIKTIIESLHSLYGTSELTKIN